MQLERILQAQGFGTRKLCRIMIWNGEVSVNGELCDDPNADFDTKNLSYTVKGEAWDYRDKSYLMLHKPSNYEC
jgi:16S rRNA pseudouridine516 synthase